MAAHNTPRLVRAKQAADYLGLPYTSLRDAAHRGLIPVVRINRSWYFAQDDLDRFVAAHRETFK